MTEEEIKMYCDKVYSIGFRNGQIEMKNNILKKINRDWSLLGIKSPMNLIIEILKKVNKVKLTKKITKIKH